MRIRQRTPQPSLAYLGLLIYCALVYIRPADWIPAVLGWPLELLAAGATGALLLLQKHPKLPLQMALLAAWAFLTFLSNVVNGYSAEAIEVGIKYFKLGIMFFLFWGAVDSVGRLRGLTIFMLFLAGVIAYQGIWMFQHGYGWAGQPLYWGGRIAWVGLWDGANAMSALFLVSIPYAAELLIGPRAARSRLLGLTCGGLILVALFLASSRGAWVALGVMVLVYLRGRIGNKGIILAAILMVGIFQFGPSRLRGGSETDEGSWHGRVYMWAEAYDMLRYYPTLGVGKDRFVDYTHSLRAHNAFLENVGTTGLIGSFVWVALIYYSFRSLVLAGSVGLSARLGSLRRATLAALTAYMAALVFISADYEPLYMLMALSAVVLRLARQETGLQLPLTFSRPDVRNILLLQVGGIVFFYLATAGLSATF